MRMRKATAALASAALATVAAGGLWVYQSAEAADHLDPPMRTDPAVTTTADTPADIADVFAWNTATTVTLVLTTAGPQAQGVGPFYDRNVLYQIHISNDGKPETSERDINIRYGRDPSGNWGVQFVGIPGATGAVAGPVQTVLTDGTLVKATAGLFDDPFFFDLQGFNQTKATGTLAITNTRNFFAGKNDTSFVIEFPRSAIENGSSPIQVWAETRRIQGS